MAQRRHRQRYEHEGHGRYLTFSCYQRLPLFGNDKVKDAFASHLNKCQERIQFQLFAWVIMPEHVHLLAVPAQGQTISPVLQQIKEPFARSVIKRWRELNASVLSQLTDPRGHAHFWQRGGGYDRNIFTDEELYEKVNYIHANPVRRELVERASDYRWSSAMFYEDSERYDGPAITPL